MKRILLPFYLSTYLFLLLQVIPNTCSAQIEKTVSNDGNNLFDTALNFQKKSERDSALHYYKQAELAYGKTGNWVGIVNSKVKLGLIYSAKRDNDSALSEFNDAIKLSSENGVSQSVILGEVYHNVGRAYHRQGKPEEAFNAFQKAFSIRKEVLEKDHLDIGKTLGNLGLISSNFYGDSKSSLEYYLESLRIKTIYHGEKGKSVWYALVGISKNYFELFDFENGVKYSQRAIKVMEQVLEEDNTTRNKDFLAGSLSNLALYHIDMYASEKAIPLLRRALFLWEEIKSERGQLYFYSNMGRAYINMGDYTRAKLYYSRAIEIAEKIGDEGKSSIANTHTAIAYIYYEGENDYSKAFEHFEKALKVKQSIYDENHHLIAGEYGNLGLCYGELNDFESAKKAYDKSKEINLKNERTSWKLDLNYTVLSRQKGDYEKAISDINLLIETEQKKEQANLYRLSKLKMELTKCYLDSNQPINAFKTVEWLRGNLGEKEVQDQFNLSKFYILALGYKADLCFKEYEALNLSRKDGLQSALQNYKEAIRIADQMTIRYKAKHSKELLMRKVYPYYEGILTVVSELYELTGDEKYIEEAFEYIEKSKSGLMREAISNAQAKTIAGIPKEMVEKETELGRDIAYLEETLSAQLQKEGERNAELTNMLSTKLTEKKQALLNYIERLEKNYPEYYQLKFSKSVVSLEHVQKELLSESETLVEYLVGEEQIFVIVINQEKASFVKLEKDFPLDDWTIELIESQTSKRNTNTALYASRSFQMYQKLVEPLNNNWKENVIIVADGLLNNLPFESLLTAPPSKNIRFKSHPYLIKDYCISYAFSATLRIRKKAINEKEQKEKKTLAFAPFYEQDSIALTAVADIDNLSRAELNPLLHSGEEVKAISALTNGDMYLGESASEYQFKKQCPLYNIIHCSTHGIINDEVDGTTYLVFNAQKDSVENGALFLSEIYNLSLNNELTVLSACETGLGRFQKGEGAMSLARAFRAAGSSCVLSSLWKVNDEGTKKIMIDFYKQLQSGLSKNQALRQAKLNYLENNTHPMAHPYYWSGFILIGDVTAF